jgi:hypothetical protein
MNASMEVRMRILGTFCTLALLLFLIAPTRGVAQDRDNDKPKAQDEAKPQGQRTPQGEIDRDNNKAQQEMNKQDEKARAKAQKEQEKQDKKMQQEQDRNGRDQQRDQHPGENHPMDNRQDRDHIHPADNRPDMRGDEHQHRAGDRGRHIPDEQFHFHFGREHRFHVQRTEIVNVSQPVVVYSGYSFQLVDPWPADWSYDDDCYIDYIDDQYYLFDVMHPGIRIAVFVVD